MSVLADLQTEEALLCHKGMTLGIDGTSIMSAHLSDAHLSDAHLTTVNQCYLLSIVYPPDGTARGYTNQVCTALQQIANIYSKFNNKDLSQVTLSIIQSITNFISDRAPVNGKVAKLLKECLDLDMLELKCNLHPLDGIANKCRECLKRLDKEREAKSETFGSSCSLANILYGISKMR